MLDSYCSNLSERKHYICGITGTVCPAVDIKPGNPSGYVREYDERLAKRCPGFGVPPKIAGEIKEFRKNNNLQIGT